MSISVITIEFEGIVDSVVDKIGPYYLKYQMPVSSPFFGSFQIYDTKGLWPQPGEYTTPELAAIFKIADVSGDYFEKEGFFSETIWHESQIKIRSENGRIQLSVYGHSYDTTEKQWAFEIEFYFTVDASSGTIQRDLTTQSTVSLSVTVGGHLDNGHPRTVDSVMYGHATSIEQPIIVQAESIIRIGFQGQVDSVVDKEKPPYYLKPRMPVSSPFFGCFQIYDTRGLWPQPGEYTTPELAAIFKIADVSGVYFEKEGFFSETIWHESQIKIRSENGRIQLSVYGHSYDTTEKQWAFEIEFYFTVDASSGTIQRDLTTQSTVSLSVTVGGHLDNGHPRTVDSVMYGHATSIEQPVIVKSQVSSHPPSTPTGFHKV